MKSELLDLIRKIDNIRSHFHIKGGGGGFPSRNTIFDTPEFSNWKQEIQLVLQEIYDRTNDKFIWSLLVILQQRFNGWKDEQYFNELAGGLIAVSKNIDKYYASPLSTSNKTEEVQTVNQKSPKIFISHSSLDKDYVSKLIELFDGIGLNEQQVFCSSITGYDIPLNEDIYEYLKQQFQNHELHVIFILSDNYYDSVACMNEMGASWILQNKYTTILLPGFEFKEIKGAINPRQIGLKLDNELTDVKNKLGQLKDSIIEEFGLTRINDVRWEEKRNEFINAIYKQNTNGKLSENSQYLLKTACSDPQGTIIKIETLDGTSICVGKIEFITSQERREVAKWEDSLRELLKEGYIEEKGTKGEIFVTTLKGYDYISDLKSVDIRK
ncbi:TIR domain-containing protein [Mobilisporobacter senegalensis]|uniref:TIR domain-containing protein n=1 Tax=Mobilisporobacter senegalensis TaxID=1329262 RepID=A0A3N1XSB8_9FIRM|nr:toll/interleukin-1 receptor domain-containing protein [Mobilisporobacter senegalensis]ROR28082.1 TIR domain-containing protein [Mobilisporobacter senegalensis]